MRQEVEKVKKRFISACMCTAKMNTVYFSYLQIHKKRVEALTKLRVHLEVNIAHAYSYLSCVYFRRVRGS